MPSDRNAPASNDPSTDADPDTPHSAVDGSDHHRPVEVRTSKPGRGVPELSSRFADPNDPTATRLDETGTPTSSPNRPGPPPASARTGATTSLWRMKSYLRPYSTRIVVMWVAALLSIVTSITIPIITGWVVDDAVSAHRLDKLWLLGFLAVGLGISDAALVFIRRWTQTRAVLGLETTIRNDIYAHLQRLPMNFHGGWQGGQLLSRVTTDLSTIRRFLGFGMLFLVVNIVQLTITVVMMLRMYWPLGLLVAVSAVPIMLLTLRFEKAYRKVSRQVQDGQGDLATLVEESAVGLRTIKAYGRRHHVFDGFDDGARKVYGISMQKVRLSAKFFTFLEVVPNVTLAAVLLVGALAVGMAGLTVGTLVAFTTLMLQLVWPISSLGFILASGQEAMTAADRVMEVLDTEPTITSGVDVIEKPRGHLRFEGVGFHFPDSDKPVLRDVWLDIAPGETVALVGATGSGKTTMTALVPRLYDVTAGRITIDGHDVRSLTLPTLRSIVATAFEEPTLFSMSVRENLRLGRNDAHDDEVEAALEVAQAQYVHDLPWDLDTRIGEQGMSLSGGQRQRLALARAVISAPKILVLDDTLSALDVETEALVEEALRRVLADATGIVVAHRASTVLLADKVALLQNGTITHVGTHAELLASVPAYRELLAQDAEEDLEEEGVLR